MTPDEMAELMPGLRLHVLPWFNLDAAPRYNFFKSLFYSQHGLGDVMFYYSGSGILSGLGLPVTEKTLFITGGITNLLLIAAAVVFCCLILREPLTGIVLIPLMASSAFYVFVSKTGWGRLSFVPLIQVSLLLVQWGAHRSARVSLRLLFGGLAFFAAMTDGLYIVACMVVLAIAMREGPIASRLAGVVRDRLLLLGVVAWGLGFAVDLLVAAAAAAKGSNLTLLRYIQLRGSHGGLVPTSEMFVAWARAVDWYFPFRAGWVLVLAGFVLAAPKALRGDAVAVVWVWFAMVSFGVMRYASGLKGLGMGFSVPTWINAYSLALPGYILLAGLFSRAWRVAILKERSLVARVWRGVLCAGGGAFFWLAVHQSAAIAYNVEQAVDQVARRDACRTVKAVSYYIRELGPANAYVFHLSSDVFLGHFGEFYYGLSYSRSSTPEEPNRLLDFGREVFGKEVAPDELYEAYRVPHFDYYVDFMGEGGAWRSEVISKLLKSGARVVLVVRYQGREIGRVLSYRPVPERTFEYAEAAAAWDQTYGRLDRLFQQSLAGTSYHFGYNWRRP
ncbi:MAG: hypothetical protein HYS14_01915 [Candidatus Rokubacteria bacterium]|nr:hypothetical protein [Candidatus Rokubacteria bacterium]